MSLFDRMGGVFGIQSCGVRPSDFQQAESLSMAYQHYLQSQMAMPPRSPEDQVEFCRRMQQYQMSKPGRKHIDSRAVKPKQIEGEVKK